MSLITRIVVIVMVAGATLLGAAPSGAADESQVLPDAVVQRFLDGWTTRTRTAPAAAPSSTTANSPDPLGDVTDMKGAQTVEPRGDVSSVSFVYAADHLDVTVVVPAGVDPATSPNWRANLSGIVAVIDVNGDDQPDFGGVAVADGDGKLQGGVVALPPSPNPSAFTGLSICAASASYNASARSYTLSMPSSCIGNAYEARGGAGLLFNRATTLSSDFDLTIDVAPNGSDLLGVHRDTSKNGSGYRFVASDGGIFTFGNASFLGSMGDIKLNRPIVGMESTRTGKGYWMVASDGGIFTFGDAAFFGSTGALVLNQPITAMAATPTGKGYWLVAKDGGVFTFGDAAFFGATPTGLGGPVVGMASTPDGRGYWLTAADGTVVAYGNATKIGSAKASTGNPVVGIAPTPSGRGYWIAFADGGVAPRGDAQYLGDGGALRLNAPIVGIAATPTGRGYWLLGRDGGVFSHGDAAFYGSTGNLKLNQPVLGIAV